MDRRQTIDHQFAIACLITVLGTQLGTICGSLDSRNRLTWLRKNWGGGKASCSALPFIVVRQIVDNGFREEAN